jgi:hypothetical protein
MGQERALWRRARAGAMHLDLRFADQQVALVDAVTGQPLVTFARRRALGRTC